METINHSPARNRTLGARLVAAMLVAIGLLAVSVTVMIWVIRLVETSKYRIRVHENLVVRPDGEPLIQTYTSGIFDNITYRTLKGEPIELKREGQLSGAHLTPPVEPPPLFDWPLRWGQSLGVNDGAKPRGAWYLVRNAEPEGQAYFIGYDSFSRLPIGYIGRSGFRQSLPPESEWFEFGRQEFGYGAGGVAASVQRMSYNRMADLYDYGTDRATLRPWKVYLIDGDRVVEVDLRERTVRQVVEFPGITSIGLLTEADDRPEGKAESDRDWRFVHRLAMRSEDRLVVLNPDSGMKHEFVLPETVRSQRFEVYSLKGDTVILIWTDSDGPPESRNRLTWIAANGSVEREESVELGQSFGESMSPQTASVAFALGAPVPLAWAVFTGAIVPIGMYQSHDVPSYAAGVAKTLEMSWPGLIAVIVLGCVSAWIVWRWQRRYARGATAVWCTFAFLMGLNGLAAYWLEHRRAMFEACGECGSKVPRDRDACARCDTPFAAPKLVGTEIFA